MARDFSNGWPGLKEYAAKVGVCTQDDKDDVAAAKIKAVLQDMLPEEEEEEIGSGSNTIFETET